MNMLTQILSYSDLPEKLGAECYNLLSLGLSLTATFRAMSDGLGGL